MERFNRAVRRHHVARLKAKRKNYWGYRYLDDSMSAKRLGMIVQTPCNCSCDMCGNPRKFYGALTRQEVIHTINLKEGHHALD